MSQEPITTSLPPPPLPPPPPSQIGINSHSQVPQDRVQSNFQNGQEHEKPLEVTHLSPNTVVPMSTTYPQNGYENSVQYQVPTKKPPQEFPNVLLYCPCCQIPWGTYNELTSHCQGTNFGPIIHCKQANCTKTFAGLNKLDDYLDHVQKDHIPKRLIGKQEQYNKKLGKPVCMICAFIFIVLFILLICLISGKF
uniref:C2H2-type domain-containing protein n=1 Tax=Acrobeloides nanus TaxID=290746 RepID=A0A914EJ07_9BILA